MPKPSCTNSTSMSRETSRSGTGAQILPKISKCIPKDINSTPNTAKQINAPSTSQLCPQEQRTWNHDECPKEKFSHPQNTLAHYTPHHSTHLARNTVPVKVAYILGIWKINCLIPLRNVEQIGRHRRMREGHD